MKIKSLHFKNLNSLKGEFKIDFTVPVLANAGLFAITGPTGAGKSTILDAITLALYSYTPRLEEITDTSIAENGVIVTKHMKDAFSHIVFEVNDVTYKAEWSIAKNRNNNWNKVIHKLNILEEDKFVTIKDKLRETQAEITKITCLTKDQFTKAIVLSQGKFDEFLKSDKDKRYELLEIITGTSIYRLIGQKVFEALREKNEEVRVIESQLQGIEVLTADQVSDIETNKSNLEMGAHELSGIIEKFNGLKQTKERIKSLLDEKVKIDAAFIHLEEKVNAFKPNLVKLEEHERALPLQVDFNNWKNAATEINRFTQNIIELDANLEKQKSKKALLIETLTEHANTSVDETNFITQLDFFYRKIDGLDKDIIKAESALKQQGDALNNLYKQIPGTSLTEIKPIQKSVDELNAYIAKKDNQLSELLLPSDFNGIDYQNAIDNLNTKILTFTQIINIKSNIDNLDQSIIEQKRFFESLDEAIVLNDNDLERLKKLSDKLNGELTLLQDAYNANQALLSLEDYRDLLEDGSPCPCCGSTVHPYAIQKPKLNGKLEEKLQNKNAEVEENNASIRLFEDTLLEQGANKKNINTAIKSLNAEISEKLKKFNKFCSDLSLSKDSTVDALTTELNALEESISNLKTHKVWYETKQPLLNYIELLTAYNSENKKLQILISERKDLFGAKIIADYKQETTLSWASVNRDIADTISALKDETRNRSEKETTYESLNTKLSLEVLLHAFESIEAIGLVLLSDADNKEYLNQKNELSKSKVGLDTRNEENRMQYKAAINLDDENVNHEELIIVIKAKSKERDEKMTEIGKLNSIIETNAENLTRVAAIQTQREIAKSEQAYYKIIADLIGDADGDKFNNIIQRITLRHLFKMTNQRLMKIMDRYQVDLGSDKHEDTIWVIDTYMGDERRVIDSVSGGERFVISLAMALSLSDLASNNVRLDSVFIDEGFGSLSPDELDSAVTMLERMQVENEKTVGIISHVESLKERISTQIVVEKLQNGESTIFLKSNGKTSSLAVA